MIFSSHQLMITCAACACAGNQEKKEAREHKKDSIVIDGKKNPDLSLLPRDTFLFRKLEFVRSSPSLDTLLKDHESLFFNSDSSLIVLYKDSCGVYKMGRKRVQGVKGSGFRNQEQPWRARV